MGADLAPRRAPDQRGSHTAREEGLLELDRPGRRHALPALLPLARGDQARERALRCSRQRQRDGSRRPRRHPPHRRARAELHRADEGRPPPAEHRHRADSGCGRGQPARRPGRRPRRLPERPQARGRHRRHRPARVRGGLRRLPATGCSGCRTGARTTCSATASTRTTGCSAPTSRMSRRRSQATRRFPRPPWAVRRTTSGRGLPVGQAPSSLERTR